MGDRSEKGMSVLFVCLGNFCRSPMAEAVFRRAIKSHPGVTVVDSAGTGGYHVGEDPDSRTMQILEDNGITDYRHKGRKIEASDFTSFDYIFAMDRDNLRNLQQMQSRAVKKDTGAEGKDLGQIILFGDFGGKKGEIVNDPYFGDDDGFEIAFEQVDRFSKGFIAQVLDQKEESR